jgi:hypothetical protein
MNENINFTTGIFGQITNTITVIHNLLSDVTSRSDLMAQEMQEQEQRIAKLERIIYEKDHSR